MTVNIFVLKGDLNWKIVVVRFFFCRVYVALWRGHFWPEGYNLNTFGRDLLDNVSYHLSRP